MYVFYVQYLLKFNVHHSDVFNIKKNFHIPSLSKDYNLVINCCKNKSNITKLNRINNRKFKKSCAKYV